MAVVVEEGLPGQTTTQSSSRKRPTAVRRLFAHGILHRADYIAVGLLACLTAITRLVNLANYPRWFVDEGVYASQAWAVLHEHHLAPYTYWYDHPPLGWVQISSWWVLTGSWQRNANASILAGREYMVVMAVASVALTYVLARRLGFRRVFAVIAGLLYILSPLAMAFSRYVLLDNIAITWVLAAMVLALSPQRRIAAVFGSGVCLAVAVLSKETALLMAPAVVWMLWQNFHSAPNWKTARFVFFTVTPIICAFYPLYAWIKNELLPGPGHVSLLQGQLLFQLGSRNGSGSIFDAQSDARLLIQNAWLGLDPWLPLVGVAAILPALFVPKLRGLAIALIVQVAILLRGGYLPYPFIIALLPFMALLVAGIADTFWLSLPRWRRGGFQAVLVGAGTVVCLVMATVFTTKVVPTWLPTLTTEFTAPATRDQERAIQWVADNLPRNAQLVTEGELWMDLRRVGFDDPEVIWTYKVDTDPEVLAAFGGIDGLDYLVLDRATLGIDAGTYPILSAAINDASVMATFGNDDPNQIVVLKVTHNRPITAAGQPPG